MIDKVSAIIPAYNNQDTIVDSILSFLDQSHKIYEIVVIDDASTDSTQSKIESIKDKRIKLIKNHNRIGTANSFNKAFKITKGDFIVSHGGDDLSIHDRVSKQLEILNEKKYKVVLSDAFFTNLIGQSISAKPAEFEVPTCCNTVFKRLFWHGNYLIAPSAIFTRNFFEENKMFDYSLHLLNDFDLWIKAAINDQIYVMNDKLVKYTRTSANLGSRGKQKGSLYDYINRIENEIIYENLFIKLKQHKELNFEGNHYIKYINDNKIEDKYTNIINSYLSHRLVEVRIMGLKMLFQQLNTHKISLNLDYLNQVKVAVFDQQAKYYV